MKPSLVFAVALMSLAFSCPAFSLETISKIYTSRGGTHTCVLGSEGHLKCWGGNNVGQLGLGREEVALPVSSDLANLNWQESKLGRVKQLALAANGTCALTAAGQVYCWGRGDIGMLGNGKEENLGLKPRDLLKISPVQFGNAGEAIQITAGIGHFCALFKSGKVKCWGYNGGGILGIGSVESDWGSRPEQVGEKLPYVKLGRGVRAIQISAGTYHTCVLTSQYQVKCWGQDTRTKDGPFAGILGPVGHELVGLAVEEMGDALLPLDFGLNASERIEKLVAGGFHTCLLLRDPKLPSGAVKCWGNNPFGQLGTGDTTAIGAKPGDLAKLKPIPLGLEPGDSVRDVTAGENHTCVLFASGGVKCFGLNDSGQLGTGDVVNWGSAAGQMGKNLPYVPLAPGMKIEAVASAGSHTCAIIGFVNGLKCWGENSSYQLGLPHNDNVGSSADQMGNSLPYVDLSF